MPEDDPQREVHRVQACGHGAHSPRLIQLRASEIVEESGIAEELDAIDKIALWELARLAAVIEAIDRDLSAKGLTDRNGKERYLLQRRERYSRGLLELSDRVLAARARARSRPSEPEAASSKKNMPAVLGR